MLNHTLIKRSLIATLAAGAASFPASAQAMRIIESGPASDATPPAAVSSPSAQAPGASAQSGFQWGDAGIGAAGAVVLLGAGAGAASATRRRRIHRAIVG